MPLEEESLQSLPCDLSCRVCNRHHRVQLLETETEQARSIAHRSCQAQRIERSQQERKESRKRRGGSFGREEVIRS